MALAGMRAVRQQCAAAEPKTYNVTGCSHARGSSWGVCSGGGGGGGGAGACGVGRGGGGVGKPGEPESFRMVRYGE